MHNDFAFLCKTSDFFSITNSTVQRLECDKVLRFWDPALTHISLINYRIVSKLRLSCNVIKRIWNNIYQVPAHKFQISGSIFIPSINTSHDFWIPTIVCHKKWKAIYTIQMKNYWEVKMSIKIGIMNMISEKWIVKY